MLSSAVCEEHEARSYSELEDGAGVPQEQEPGDTRDSSAIGEHDRVERASASDTREVESVEETLWPRGTIERRPLN